MDEVFRFYLMRNNNNEYYYVGSSGGVHASNIKRRLKYPPIDWQDASVEAKSSDKNWIATREFTSPLEFALDGAKILRNIFYNQGFTAKCYLRIEKLDTYTQGYHYWHSGEVDFSQFEDSDDTVRITLLEQGLTGLIKNRENTDYEVPFKDSDERIRMSGVWLKSNAKWILGDSNDSNSVDYLVDAGQFMNVPSTPFGTNVQAGNFISPLSPESYVDGYVSNSRRYAFAITAADWNGIQIYGQLPMAVWFSTVGGGIDASFSMIRVKVVLKIGRWENSVYTNHGNHVLGYSDYYPRNSWHYPYIYLNGSIPSIPIDSQLVLTTEFEYKYSNMAGNPLHDGYISQTKVQFFADTSILDIKYNAKVVPTTARGIKYIDFLKRFVSMMSDGQYTAVSDYLSNPDDSAQARFKTIDNSPYNTVITCGDSLRAIGNAVVKTTFRDIADDLWARYGLDWSVEGNKVRFEPIDYFFNNTQLFSVSKVRNLRISVLNDRIFNNLKIGYADRNNDMIDGRQEFNTEMSFLASANKVIENEENLVAPFNSAVYSIESIRAKTSGEDTKDNKFDNDVFVIELDPVKRQGGISQTAYSVPLTFNSPQFLLQGVDDPVNIYNVALSPKRALYRHMRRIRSLLDIGVLKFQTTERNPELESNLWAGYIKEIDDVNLATSYHVERHFQPIFKPIVLDFECEPPYDLAEILNNSTKGYVRFKYGDNYYKGFIIDVGCTPATRDVYNFKLLSHASNDLSTIKRN